MTTELATLGGGCFWCLEAIYQDLKGVELVVSGYAGGQLANPSYEAVTGGKTGHAEVVNILFDPEVISYRDILRMFFISHDPTTKDRQGNDVGPQYRSVIFCHSAEQIQIAEEVIAEITRVGVWPAPIVTQVEAFTAFYPAEDYHQNFYRNNPEQGYCLFVIAPKLAQFRRMFAQRLKG
ncbi:MAG: peptide-methionine (S)-S-oxide reductase MsrA [Burkholderiaceae bacterium]|nr:peptide-methionine (S)-S-oxide reductase MsrA [Burkholderiaceae bacterium]